MRDETAHLTDDQLLVEIKRQWDEVRQWREEMEHYGDPRTPATDYLSDEIEQHIDMLEAEARSRGLSVDRDAYLARFHESN